MTDQQQTDAMAKILGRLNNVGNRNSNDHKEKKVHLDPTSRAAQTDAMAAVLEKLNAATRGAAETIVVESQNNTELDIAWKTMKTSDGVSVAQYTIQTEKRSIGQGLTKTFYHVYDNDIKDRIYQDISLFETAMGVVKHILYTQKENRIQRLLDLDQEYMRTVVEMHTHKQRLKTLNESSTKYDVTKAKYSNARGRMTTVKMKILETI